MSILTQQSPGTSNAQVENTLLAIAGFLTQPYNNMVITYVTVGNGIGEIATVVTKMGVTTVQTMTLTYDVNNNLSTISVA